MAVQVIDLATVPETWPNDTWPVRRTGKLCSCRCFSQYERRGAFPGKGTFVWFDNSMGEFSEDTTCHQCKDALPIDE